MGYASLGLSYLLIAAGPWIIKRLLEGRVRHRSAALFYFGSIIATGMATGVLLALVFLKFLSGSFLTAMGEACGGIFRASQGFLAASRWNYLLAVAAAAILFSQGAFLLCGGTRLLKVTSRLKNRTRDGFSCPALPLISRTPWTRFVYMLPKEKMDAQTLGLWRPRILVTQGLVNAMTGEELSAVAAHENAHRRGHDNLLLTIAKAFSLTLFYLPGPKMALRRMCQSLEKAADRKAVLASGGPIPVASAMARIVQLSRQEIGTDVALSASGAGCQDIVARLDVLINENSRTGWRLRPLFAFAALSAAILLTFASSAFAVTGEDQRSAFVCFTEHAQEAPVSGVCELGHPNH